MSVTAVRSSDGIRDSVISTTRAGVRADMTQFVVQKTNFSSGICEDRKRLQDLESY
jgi:hypothetical protein